MTSLAELFLAGCVDHVDSDLIQPLSDLGLLSHWANDLMKIEPLLFRCDFIGTLIVVPDVGSLAMPGARAESNARHKGEESEGLRGLKSLGVRDLHHRMAFLVRKSSEKDNSWFC